MVSSDASYSKSYTYWVCVTAPEGLVEGILASPVSSQSTACSKPSRCVKRLLAVAAPVLLVTCSKPLFYSAGTNMYCSCVMYLCNATVSCNHDPERSLQSSQVLGVLSFSMFAFGGHAAEAVMQLQQSPQLLPGGLSCCRPTGTCSNVTKPASGFRV